MWGYALDEPCAKQPETTKLQRVQRQLGKLFVQCDLHDPMDRWGGFQTNLFLFFFASENGGVIQFDTYHLFQMRLVQPPTSR